MRLIAHIQQRFTESGCFNRVKNPGVCLSYQLYFQKLSEQNVRRAFFRQHIPEDGRVSVGSEKSGMGDGEIPVRTSGGLAACPFKITFVKSVGDKFHGSPGHSLEFLLDKRGDCDNPYSLVEHLLLHPLMPFLGRGSH